jgi:hypothetical protein
MSIKSRLFSGTLFCCYQLPDATRLQVWIQVFLPLGYRHKFFSGGKALRRQYSGCLAGAQQVVVLFVLPFAGKFGAAFVEHLV